MKGIKIKGFSDYEIFPEEGKVFSLKSNRFVGSKDKITGYWKVNLTDDVGNKHHFQLSRVIWTAVNGEIPQGLQVNHISEDKDDNSIFNLNLMTPKENSNWGTRTLRAMASIDYNEIAKKNSRKLINRQDLSKQVGAYQNGVLVMVFQSTKDAERSGFINSHISKCCRGERKSHKGYQWKYLS